MAPRYKQKQITKHKASLVKVSQRNIGSFSPSPSPVNQGKSSNEASAILAALQLR